MALKGYRNNNKKPLNIPAECRSGAVTPGCLAPRFLFINITRIILLHKYMRPAAELAILRSQAPVLKQTAEEELATLENKLMEEFALPAENIEKIAAEVHPKTIMESCFSNHTNIYVISGPGTDNQNLKDSYKNTIRTIMNTWPGQLFLIADSIILIQKNRISIITEKEEIVTHSYIGFLKDIAKDDIPRTEIINSDNQKTAYINEETAKHFSYMARISVMINNSAEQVPINGLLRANAA